MLNGDALPASHSAHPLGFTAHFLKPVHSRGIATFYTLFSINRNENALWRRAQSRSNSFLNPIVVYMWFVCI